MEVECIIQGDRNKTDNFSGWIALMIKLPGTNSYNQTMSLVYKVGGDGRMFIF